jgi:hypothetical protein
VDHHARDLLLSLEFFTVPYAPAAALLSASDALHHELWHLLELEITPDETIADPAWMALNAPGFRYLGADGEDWLPGFVNPHATSREREDRASVYQYITARPDDLCHRLDGDVVVAAKVREIWQRVSDRLNPEGGAFLDKMAPCVARWLGSHP